MAAWTRTSLLVALLCNVVSAHSLFKMEAIMYRNQSRLGYLLGGIAVGSVVAVFLAPKSGPDTRRYLRAG